ncbi:hypothetical protein [Pedobacter sp. WC2423]|uniref:hypothetical protein n=1 Tax=Pedobacter sp. WC2423 TaxID=3234142 RepID=UPI0034661148
MNQQNPEKLSPSQFYRQLRPENFSDSEEITEFKLPKEVLAFELDKLSTNQKQDEFEVFCRRLAEKFVCPNLIPQVGPTGGGDGKTDFETHPVSIYISDRWFIPENGWEKDEKWAFAISCKKAWNQKMKDDVKKIFETGREYTKIFFMTNQTPSSKTKKDIQDKLYLTYNVEVTILDAKWMLEKIYENNLTNLAVESLNLSNSFREDKNLIGKNDVERKKMLDEIERNISKPNRYFEYDFQLVDDAIEAAILARMLELPKDEVLGKFDRAIRLSKKVNNEKHWIRIYYQYAWTSLNWYDDYQLFIDNYKKFKTIIDKNSSINELENLYTLYNLLKNVKSFGDFDLKNAGIDILEERSFLMKMLTHASIDEQRPASALSARTFKASEELFDAIVKGEEYQKYIIEIINIFNKCEGFLDYDFDSFKETIFVLGDVLSKDSVFDELVDTVAFVTEKRTSEVAAGRTFFNRAAEKLDAKLHKQAIVYFGKAVIKLAKDESQEGMYLSLRGLADAYANIGLLWAANSCLIAATAVAFKPWFQNGTITKRAYECVNELAKNELFIGRIPSIINWFELLRVLSHQLNLEQHDNDIPDQRLIDSCLAVRLMNSDSQKLSGYLPKILKEQDLWISEDAALYALGHIDVLMDETAKGMGLKGESELHEYFEKLAGQPFKEQIIFETNMMNDESLQINSRILGCKFIISFSKNNDLVFVAEMIMAFLEAFLATSLDGVYPSTEEILIELVKTDSEELFVKIPRENPSEYTYEIGRCKYLLGDGQKLWTIFLELLTEIVGKNFFFKDVKSYFDQLFDKEEIRERLALIFEHRKFSNNVLGEKPQLFLSDRIKDGFIELPKIAIKINDTLKNNPSEQKDVQEENGILNFDKNHHNQRHVRSIIETHHWDEAVWKAFGNAYYPDGRFVLFFAFENIVAGEKIFENWRRKFGEEDTDDVIRLTIITGIDEKNPFHYKINISKNINFSDMKNGETFTMVSRGLGVHPSAPTNLNNLLSIFNYQKKFLLCPAEFDPITSKIDIRWSKAILKRNLVVKEAWEIGINDPDRSAIIDGTIPIIPLERKSDAPILKVLEEKYKMRNK